MNKEPTKPKVLLIFTALVIILGILISSASLIDKNILYLIFPIVFGLCFVLFYPSKKQTVGTNKPKEETK